MHIPFFHRLYVRLWLAVVLAVLVLSLLVAWLLRTQAERIRAERLADVPAREVSIRNVAGEVIGRTSVQPVRVPGRGVEFHVQLPEGVKGGEQLAISLPPRPRPDGAALGDRPTRSPLNFVLLLIAFALAVALGSYPVVRRLMQRLAGLQRGVERLGAGDLQARVDESGKDEVAFLAQRFNRAADQVQALVQSQKSLLANASHELRSPLARIRMALELMETAPSAALKAELSRNINELDSLIEEILLASRLDAKAQTAAAGRPQPMHESVDLLALAAEEAARMGVALDGQDAAGHSDLLGDARNLSRMLRNLLENALRHGSSDVNLLLKAGANAFVIEVTDRGPGVPESERERIFEPFYRSAHASEQHGGVGLGLSLVRSIARQHGGSVQCIARADGGAGARFVVTLPNSSSV